MQLYRQYALELSRTLSRMPWDVIDSVAANFVLAEIELAFEFALSQD